MSDDARVEERRRRQFSLSRAQAFHEGRFGPEVGWVPTEALHPYREYDRTDEDISVLKSSIAREGFHEPLILQYDKSSGMGQLGEGNHRLRAARELRLPAVPVRVWRRSTPIVGNHPSSRDPQPLPVGLQKDYVPQELHPSRVGLPIFQDRRRSS